MTEPKWVRFEESPFKRGRKTPTYDVIAKDGEAVLGVIQWFGRWRGYAFFPSASTVYEQRCLRDIAAFIEHQNREYRESQKSRG